MLRVLFLVTSVLLFIDRAVSNHEDECPMIFCQKIVASRDCELTSSRVYTDQGTSCTGCDVCIPKRSKLDRAGCPILDCEPREEPLDPLCKALSYARYITYHGQAGCYACQQLTSIACV